MPEYKKSLEECTVGDFIATASGRTNIYTIYRIVRMTKTQMVAVPDFDPDDSKRVVTFTIKTGKRVGSPIYFCYVGDVEAMRRANADKQAEKEQAANAQEAKWQAKLADVRFANPGLMRENLIADLYKAVFVNSKGAIGLLLFSATKDTRHRHNEFAEGYTLRVNAYVPERNSMDDYHMSSIGGQWAITIYEGLIDVIASYYWD